MNLAVQLEDYIRDYGRGRFDWRTANCCHFVSKWVLRMTSCDFMQGLAETTNMREARRLIASMGGNLIAVTKKQLGQEPVNATLAQVGDVVHIPLPTGGCLGICVGQHAAVVSDTGSIVKVQMDKADYAWHLKGMRC
jgi:hypothetical protein